MHKFKILVKCGDVKLFTVPRPSNHRSPSCFTLQPICCQTLHLKATKRVSPPFGVVCFCIPPKKVPPTIKQHVVPITLRPLTKIGGVCSCLMDVQWLLRSTSWWGTKSWDCEHSCSFESKAFKLVVLHMCVVAFAELRTIHFHSFHLLNQCYHRLFFKLHGSNWVRVDNFYNVFPPNPYMKAQPMVWWQGNPCLSHPFNTCLSGW